MKKSLSTALIAAAAFVAGAAAYTTASTVDMRDIHAYHQFELPAQSVVEPGAIVAIGANGRLERVCAFSLGTNEVDGQTVNNAYDNKLRRQVRTMLASVDLDVLPFADAGPSRPGVAFLGEHVRLNDAGKGGRDFADAGCNTRIMKKLNAGATVCSVTQTLVDSITGAPSAIVLSNWGVIFPKAAFDAAGLPFKPAAAAALSNPPRCNAAIRTATPIGVQVRRYLGLIEAKPLPTTEREAYETASL